MISNWQDVDGGGGRDSSVEWIERRGEAASVGFIENSRAITSKKKRSRFEAQRTRLLACVRPPREIC
jgi:hypothetical protein